jgi:hypothetical protein
MPILEKKKIENNGVSMAVIEERGRGVDSVVRGNPQEVTAETMGETNKETNITFRLTEQEKTEYKTFFASQNISLSFGIKLAIEHLILDVKAGKGTIKRTGYFEH